MPLKRKREEGETEPSSILHNDDAGPSARLDEPFPRGGGSAVAPLDIKKAGAEATRDVFEQVTKDLKSKKSKTKKSKNTHVPEGLDAKPRIEPLLFPKIKVGTIILAQVAEIKTLEIVLALPNNLIGFASFEESDQADDEDDADPAKAYTVGTWLRCVVVGLGEAPRKRLQLSLVPDLVNQAIDEDDLVLPGMSIQGVVQSIEDHGAIIDISGKGAKGSYNAFLPTKQQETDLVKGQAVLATIKSVKNKVLTLTTKPDSAPMLPTVHQQSSLAPGTLVEVLVNEVQPAGCMCSIFGHIEVPSDVFQSRVYCDQPPEVGDKVKARVLYSHPPDNAGEQTRRLGLSLLPHVVNLTTTNTGTSFSVGQILDSARVTRVDGNLGVFLNIGLSEPAFAHISRLSDDRIEDLSVEPKFKVGTVHTARIISFSMVDDLFYVSLEAKVLAQRYLRLDQVPVGEIIKDAKVDRILPKGGVIVSLGEGINGLASEYQLSDIKYAHPEKKFKPGQTVAVRVLAVDKDAHRIKLTLKKSLINSQERILDDLEDAAADARVTGTIVAFKPRGAVLEFYGDVKGFLPISEMSEATIQDPKDHFRLGQSLTVRVVEADPERSRLIVSCRARGAIVDKDSPTVAPAQRISGNVTEKSTDSFFLELPSGERAVLPFAQLADDAVKVKAERKDIKVGDSVEVVLLDRTNQSALVSKKPSLIKAAKESKLPTDFSDITAGAQYSGYVSNVNDQVGAFIAFANKLTGLIPQAELDSLKGTLKTGDSVTARVARVDNKNSRFLLTLKEGSNSAGSVEPGSIVDATVTAVKETQLNVVVGDKQGRIDMSQLFDNINEINDVETPLAQFQKGQVIKTKVVGFHDARNHRFLPISHRSGSHVVLELCARKSVVDGDAPTAFLEGVKPGDKTLAFVNNIAEFGDKLWVNITPTIRGMVSRLDLSDDLEQLADIAKSFPIGSALECRVVAVHPQLVLTSLKDEGHFALISKVTPTSLQVRLPLFRTGIVAATDTSAVYRPLVESFTVGDIVPAHVVAETAGRTYASLRDDEGIDSANEVKEGQVLKGYIKNISNGGLFVELGRAVTGRVQISQISDAYLKDWQKGFVEGQIVEVKVISKKGSRIELSMKRSVITGEAPKQQGLSDLKVGSINDGTVRKVQDYGVFVNLEGTQLSGLCHRSEVADRPIADLAKVFSEGDRVKVKVLDVDQDKRKISLGMKASYFDEQDEEEDDENEEEDQEMQVNGGDESGNDSDVLDIDEIELGSASDSGSDSESDSEADSDDDEETAGSGLSAKFDWDGAILAEQSDSDSDSDSSDDDAPRRKKKKVDFVEDKTAQLNSRLPQSAKDFERLLVANPNSSVLWMNYMGFQLQLSEIDTARQLARRALETISAREEEERLNVWIALLNLENSFGTKESTEEVFREAAQYMDAHAMYLKMAEIYSNSQDKLEEASRVYNTACKRFGSEFLDVWIAYAQFLFHNGRAETARGLLDRGIRQLPKRLHRDIVLQLAKLEYSLGDAERGRTLFEGLVSSYPKKIDIWNVYLDQEIKRDASNRTTITQLFERIFETKLSVKQAKFMFKKWLKYEIEHGDAKGADYVKAKAAQFAESH